jgi:SAM-dependent methyltransferase
MKTPKQIVREGYDQLATAYREHYQQAHHIYYAEWLSVFEQHIPPASAVLELGCADGIPTAQYLARTFDYTGVDISPVQIEQARRNVPQGHFVVADMTTLRFPDQSFAGIIALYSIIHVPVEEQPDLFRVIYSWLQPGGCLFCIVGAGEWTGVETDWIKPGTEMYWSHTDTSTYLTWFTKIGFEIIDTLFVPEGNAGHTTFLLRK